MKKKEELELIKHVEDDSHENYINTSIDNKSIDTLVEAKEVFYSSTPKKSAECKECVGKSECVDCIIKHMLGRHVVARAQFDGWPPDRLHLLL